MKQQISLIGNLGGDPESRFLQDGTQVCNFSLATNRKWGSGENRQEETTWWRISTFGDLAARCTEYLSKGRQVAIDGRMVPDKQTGGPRIFTRQDGTVGASYEVRAFSVYFLGSAGDSPPVGGHASSDEEDEIPF